MCENNNWFLNLLIAYQKYDPFSLLAAFSSGVVNFSSYEYVHKSIFISSSVNYFYTRPSGISPIILLSSKRYLS